MRQAILALGAVMALCGGALAQDAAPSPTRSWVRGPDLREMAGFAEVSDRPVQSGQSSAQMLFVMRRRPPAELTAYFVLTVTADCASRSVTQVQLSGFDRDGRPVAGEDHVFEEAWREEAAFVLPFACGHTTVNITGEAFPSAQTAAATVWQANADADLPNPSPFRFVYLGEGGSIDNPMAVYAETSTASPVAGGRARLWVLRVWRHPAAFPGSERTTRYVLRLITYDCTGARWRSDVSYGNDAVSGNTLYSGADDHFYQISRYSSDEDELAFACNANRRAARGAPLVGISAAVADTMRRFR